MQKLERAEAPTIEQWTTCPYPDNVEQVISTVGARVAYGSPEFGMAPEDERKLNSVQTHRVGSTQSLADPTLLCQISKLLCMILAPIVGDG